MKNAVKKLLNSVNNESQQIINYCQNKEFKTETFVLTRTFEASICHEDFNSNINKLRGYHGVYIFAMKSDLIIPTLKIVEWNSVKSAQINVFGQVYDIPTKANDCFYIGSCYKQSLMTRIQTHFSEKSDSTSLKLNNNKRKWIKEHLIIHCFGIDKKFEREEQRIIITALEKKLHDNLKAIAGSPRV